MSVKTWWKTRRTQKKVEKCLQKGIQGVHVSGTELGHTELGSYKYEETLTHFRTMIPSDSQGKLPSCAGHATANVAEWMFNNCGTNIFNMIPTGKQVDGREIWKHARERYYNDLNGGLTLPQALWAARDLGIIKGDWHGFNGYRYVLSALKDGPVMVGLNLSNSWYNNYGTENGYIPDEPLVKYGHAVVLTGLTYQNGHPYVHIFNSWGEGWGVHGVCTMSVDQFNKSLISAIDTRDMTYGKNILDFLV